MKLFVYDVETTGVNPGKHGIHQISGSIWVDGQRKEAFDFKVKPNPKAIIEQEALDIGGVTLEQIQSYPDMFIVFRELQEMLGKYCDKYNKTDKYHLVGYNNRSFDDQFLRGFYLQNKDNYFGSWFWSDSHDVLVMSSVYLMDRRAQMENFKLATVAQEMGITVDPEKLHDAKYDIALTEEIYFALLGKQAQLRKDETLI